MTVKSWNAGDVLAAADMNAWAVPIAAYKTSNTTRNTLSLSADPDLQVTLPAANAFWQVQLNISYNCASGGLAWTFTTPSGATGGYSVVAQGNTGKSATWGSGALAATSDTTGGILFTGLVGTGASTGTFSFNWASNSGPASCSVNSASTMTLRRVG